MNIADEFGRSGKRMTEWMWRVFDQEGNRNVQERMPGHELLTCNSRLNNLSETGFMDCFL